jgi:hypothetical protein
VTPAGILTNLHTIIGGIAFALDYYVIDPATPSTYPMLLGRLWLYTAKVHVNWNEKKISFGRPRVHLSWATIKHVGKTQSADEGYTSDKSRNFMEGNMLSVRYLILSSVETLHEKAQEDFHTVQQVQQPTSPNLVSSENEERISRNGEEKLKNALITARKDP